MNFVLRPWLLLLLILAGWINRDQQDAIEYLLTENQVLREKLGKGRILLNDDQRRRWAVKGKVLGRKSLGKLAKIVRPDTLLRWHRELIARQWDHSDKRQSVGRPRIRQQIVDLALRMAQENPSPDNSRVVGCRAGIIRADCPPSGCSTECTTMLPRPSGVTPCQRGASDSSLRQRVNYPG